jgi:NAD-dependent dihydropyrimidine dehydrogenase PreA subunit
MLRDIVIIDESKCDGCGDCVPACHEGAIQVVNGKARLVADNLCDGLGACLGHCPQGAITVEKRDVDAFDENAVGVHLASISRAEEAPAPASSGGCPSAKLAVFGAPAPPLGPLGASRRPAGQAGGSTGSELGHWPVQLGLLPPTAPMLQGASLLIAADCVPVAFAGFQRMLLKGRVVALGCPKFDDVPGYVRKLAYMLAHNEIAEVVVARMEVPCCGGILMAALEARRRCGREVPVYDVIVGTRGDLQAWEEVPAA